MIYVHVFGQSHLQRFPQILALNAWKHKSRFKATNLGFTQRYTNSKLCLWRQPLRRQEHSDKRQLEGSLIREASPDVTPKRQRTGKEQVGKTNRAKLPGCGKHFAFFVANSSQTLSEKTSEKKSKNKREARAWVARRHSLHLSRHSLRLRPASILAGEH